MSDFIRKDALWDIINETYFNDGDPDKGLKRIYRLLLSTHGSLGIDGDQLRFTPNKYAHLNYVSYSSSIIKMPSGTVNSDTPLSIKEHEMTDEYTTIGNIVRRINYALKDIPSRDRVIFFNKTLKIRSINEICEDFSTYRAEIYDIDRRCGQKIKEEFMLRSGTEEQKMKRSIKQEIKVAIKLAKEMSSISGKK